MEKKIRALKGGSYIKGQLPPGCKNCRKGAELFFFVTGKCHESCYYCSLARNKRGEDLILANERPISSFSGIMLEVSNMNALGAAVTGGDPLHCVDLTVNYIQKMKKEFGKKFHVHLYTSGRYATEENLSKLYHAGLDEIRFHPQNKDQEKAIEKALMYDWLVGAELPIIPGTKKNILKFLKYLDSLETIKFCNMNELEATEANFKKLKEKGFEVKSENSSAIKGSEELALDILEGSEVDFTLHYCSAITKDAVQFRNRLIRTAEIVRKPYEEIRDGMIVKAVFALPDYFIPEEFMEIMMEEYEIEQDMIFLRKDNQIEISWYIADVLRDVLFERFDIKDISITYEYPTYNRTVVAKTSLREIAILDDLSEQNQED
jgi:pyruvate formate-lyase activating enzyme-like uncharacterized protein